MKSKSNKSIATKFLIKTIITIFLYSITYFLILFCVYKLFSIRMWDKTDLIYKIYLNLKQLIIPIWILGILIIIILFWRKTFVYINKIISETSKLNDDDDNYISLPRELLQIEKSVNSVKKESVKNKQNALLAENKQKELIVYLTHDLKTPLTSILGYLDLLQNSKNLNNKDKAKYLKIINEKALSLESLIDELFELTKLNNDVIETNVQKIDINLLINQIVDDFYPLLNAVNKNIIVVENEHIYFLGNPQELYRAFNNIIKNSIYYSYDNSTIKINIGIDNEYGIVSIFNQCKHYTKKEINKIFEKFYRGDKSRNSVSGGSGLGLAIAKQIIELHKGKIDVSSEGENIEFMVKLKILR